MEKQIKPLCSIIMPSFQASSFIEKSIQSIQNQTFTDWELIIIDDASHDGTVEFINNCFVEQDARISLIELEQNSGAAVARNRGIEVARGRYIAFLDSDDVWLPQKLEKQLRLMQQNEYTLTFTAYDKVSQKGDALGYVGVPEKVNYRQLLKSNVIGCSTAIYDTALIGKVYMPLLRKRQDFGLWLRILKKVDYAVGLNEPLTIYMIRQGSVSSNKKSAAKYNWILYREIENLGVIESCYYFLHYAIRGVLRSKFPKLARFFGFLE